MEAYAEAAAIYNQAGRDHLDKMGEIGQTRDRCDRAHLTAQDAFRILDLHIKDHGC